MNTHDAEFQRFLQKMEFFDNVWKQFVEQEIEENQWKSTQLRIEQLRLDRRSADKS